MNKSSGCTFITKPSARDGDGETFLHIGENTHVYSAYFDRRQNMVKVISSVIHNISSLSPIYCLMWYNDSSTPEVASATIQPWDNWK